MRHFRSSVRVFSTPEFKGNMILIGIHKKKAEALKKIDDRKYVIDKSEVKKSDRGFKAFVHYK